MSISYLNYLLDTMFTVLLSLYSSLVIIISSYRLLFVVLTTFFITSTTFANQCQNFFLNTLEVGQEGSFLTNQGKWVLYPQNSDPTPLVQSLDGKNTGGWGVADKAFANSQLKGGDFYIYYSLDENGNTTSPRIAIQMEGDQIVKIRGAVKGGGMDSQISQTTILRDKLKEFGDEGKKYFKKDSDMRRLTGIESKSKLGLKLTTSDLIFLYELEFLIEDFSYYYRKDPRIYEIISARNRYEDFISIINDLETLPKGHELFSKKQSIFNNMFVMRKELMNTEFLGLLLDHGADINAKSESGYTALMSASSEKLLETTKFLLERGANPNIKRNGGLTALMDVSEFGFLEAVRLLLDHEADISAKSESGYTALMRASKAERLEVVKLLLERGADPNAKSEGGYTALSITPLRNLEIARILIEYGAKE